RVDILSMVYASRYGVWGMNGSLYEKVSLVTGASRGIGAAIARELAVAGARVALAVREEATLRQVAASFPDQSAAITVTADVGSISDLDQLVARVVDKVGGIDVLVNNAGL